MPGEQIWKMREGSPDVAQIQPHEHQTPSPWTCWLCSCQPTLKPAHPGFSFTHQTTHYTTVVLLLSFCLYFQGVSLTAWGSEQPHSHTILLSARHLHHHVCFNETTRIFLIKSSFPCTPCHKQVQQLTQSYQPHLQRMETRS